MDQNKTHKEIKINDVIYFVDKKTISFKEILMLHFKKEIKNITEYSIDYKIEQPDGDHVENELRPKDTMTFSIFKTSFKINKKEEVC